MKVAVIGSRGLTAKDLVKYLPSDTTEIVSGGTKFVIDKCKEKGKTIKIFITNKIM